MNIDKEKADATRPVLLNPGQGVAYDNSIGRGVRRNHPEDYAEYLKGCDIGSFNIYPVVLESPEAAVNPDSDISVFAAVPDCGCLGNNVRQFPVWQTAPAAHHRAHDRHSAR